MLIIGMVFSLSESEGRRKGRSISKSLTVIQAIAYTSLICIPISVYCYFVAPDWTWMYWADPRETSLLVVITAYLLYYAALLLGYFLAWAASRRSKKSGLATLGIGAICLLAFWSIHFKRAFYVGSRQEFFSGKAVILHKVYPLFPMLLVSMTIAAAVLIWLSLRLSGRLANRV